MSTKSKSLFICLTPLQMLIAIKIIEEQNLNYDVLCLSYNDNEKYNYYFSKISEKCDFSYRYIVKSGGKIGRVLEFLKYRFFLNNILENEYEKVFLASIDNPFFHLILSLVKFREIQTFDDGTANIYRKSAYYVFPKKSALQQVILKFLGNSYHTQQVINESRIHHTIYSGFENITSPLKALKLIKTDFKVSFDKTIKIYLGQPLEDLNFKNEDKIFNFLKMQAVDHYFPHPREKKKYGGFNYISTPLIFEDYMLDLFHQGYKVELFTILSSAALNVSHLHNVIIYVLHDCSLKSRYSELYSLFNGENFKMIIIP